MPAAGGAACEQEITAKHRKLRLLIATFAQQLPRHTRPHTHTHTLRVLGYPESAVDEILRDWCVGVSSYRSLSAFKTQQITGALFTVYSRCGWLGSRVASVLDSGAEGPGFKSQSRRCWVTVLDKLFTPIVPLFTKQQNW